MKPKVLMQHMSFKLPYMHLTKVNELHLINKAIKKADKLSAFFIA
jgi:hypothetical protein